MKSCFVIDVGHGNAAVLFGSHSNIIVDAGPGLQLIKFLESMGVTESLALIISHADADHVRGAIALLSKAVESNQYRLLHIYANPDSRNTDAWDDFVHWANRASTMGTRVQVSVGAGQCGPFDLGECLASVVAPTVANLLHGVGGQNEEGQPLSANSLSAVVKFSVDNKDLVLLPGDMDIVSLQSILSSEVSLSSGVLIYPHHGGRPGTGNANQTAEFVAELIRSSNPEYVVFSSRANDAKFPSQPVVNAVLGQPTAPRILSIGESPVVSRSIMGMTPCPHHNGVGSIKIGWDAATSKIVLSRIDYSKAPHGEVPIT